MTESANGYFVVEPQPVSAHLHLHRRAGVTYTVLAVVVFVVVILGVVSYLSTGRWLMAAVAAVIGTLVAGFLGVLAFSILAPDLHADAAGVRGRTGWGKAVAAGWDQVVVDTDKDRTPKRLQLRIDGEPLVLDAHAWYGFHRLVLLLATDPAAAGSTTPEARAEIAAMLGGSPR